MRKLLIRFCLAFFINNLCGVSGVLGSPVPLLSRLPLLSSDSAYTVTRDWEQALTQAVVTTTFSPADPSRLFVAELPGRILTLSGPERTNVSVFLDLADRISNVGEHGLCSMTFHPGYATNGQFFVFYSHQASGSPDVYNRLSRFRVDPSDPNRALPDSEEPMISQLHRETVHNAGDLHFGPDGYLYVSLGDEGYSHFSENAGRWDINYFSGILRIDVDHRLGNLPPSPHPSVHPGTYLVPQDNPFLNRTNYVIGTDDLQINIQPEDIIGEFWAIGMRNPWRMSFDPESGDLYANDVGVASREEVNIVARGGHHGWFFKEGTKPWPFFVPATGLIDPIHEYEHTLGRVAITASLFYRGTRYPELDGSYLFADLTGQIYAMRRLQDGRHGTPELIAYSPFIVSMSLDPVDGSILIGGAGISRLTRLATEAPPLPPVLSETSLFSSIRRLIPAPGLVAYEVNQAFWSDHAIKRRWFGLPKGSGRVTFHDNEPWEAPAGTVWVKHFDFAMSDVDPTVRRRLETRVMMRTTNGVYGATYRWNSEQTDADLVAAAGAEEDLVIATASGSRTQRWRYPSRTECLACHTPLGGHALSFNSAQLNRPDKEGRNQIVALQEAGYFHGNPEIRPNLLPVHPALDDESASVESRVRSYLEVNCSQCHQPGGPSRSPWTAQRAVPLGLARIVGEPAVHQIDEGAIKIIDPNRLPTSILYRRVAEFGPLHMPPLGTFVTNTQAVALLARWVTNDLPRRPVYSVWAKEYFTEEYEPFGAPGFDPDEDGDSNLHEFLVGTQPLSYTDRWRVRLAPAIDGGGATMTFTRKANRWFEIETSDSMAGPWQRLDDPANRPWLGSADIPVTIRVPQEPEARFIRVRVTEP